MKEKKSEMIPYKDPIVLDKRRGLFEEGIDGRGNPYEKKYYPDEGVYTKQEKLKSGKVKSTIIK